MFPTVNCKRIMEPVVFSALTVNSQLVLKIEDSIRDDTLDIMLSHLEKQIQTIKEKNVIVYDPLPWLVFSDEPESLDINLKSMLDMLEKRFIWSDSERRWMEYEHVSWLDVVEGYIEKDH